MSELDVIRISVRNLVEFILRSGDIDNRISTGARADAMQQGSRIHRKIQKRMGADYRPEVTLRKEIETGRYLLVLEGRADGIITQWDDKSGQDKITIDEIKGVYKNLDYLDEPVSTHLAQAKCYAFIYGEMMNVEQIGVQMTYCNIETEEIKYFREEYVFSELRQWFYDVIEQYRKWTDFQYEWRQIMVASAKQLEFPFAYRKGQKELAMDVYRTILRKKNVFIQAPTGTGKTLTTIFPSIKAVGETLAEKIFYLTAKTMTATVALETFALLMEKGYQAKTIQITAKEKMCPLEEMECNPLHCPYAKGHYDRVNDAVFELLQTDTLLMTRDVLLDQAERHNVCPFEMSLDVSSWCDNVICDYNYVFDPNVYLKRFFAEGVKGEYLFLVDESHNLVERARQMYSAALVKEDFLLMNRLLKGKDEKLEKHLKNCNAKMLQYKRECETYREIEEIDSFVFSLMRLLERLDFFLQKHLEFPERKEVQEFYFQLLHFLDIFEGVDERYVIYTEHDEEERFCMKLFCVDPSYHLQERLDKGRSTIFFSATLLPVQYYKDMLSTKKDNYAIYATTVFSKEQRLLLIGRDVSSKYTRRNALEYQRIAEYILKIASAKTGNYMVFFPSYKMMQEVYLEFLAMLPEEMKVICQQTGMNEEMREEFLLEFTEKKEETMVAFCVLGGIFGEGIDLKEDLLIGAIIVGTGLPQIGNEREILKHYYDQKNGMGFEYAYRYPGMNKVLQAAGRVIRTVEDRGVIALLDERFLESSSKRLFPREWEDYKLSTLAVVESQLFDFWEKL